MNIEFKEIKERSPDSGIRVIRKVNGKLREWGKRKGGPQHR